jgi:hypothetical protein
MERRRRARVACACERRAASREAFAAAAVCAAASRRSHAARCTCRPSRVATGCNRLQHVAISEIESRARTCHYALRRAMLYHATVRFPLRATRRYALLRLSRPYLKWDHRYREWDYRKWDHRYRQWDQRHRKGLELASATHHPAPAPPTSAPRLRFPAPESQSRCSAEELPVRLFALLFVRFAPAALPSCSARPYELSRPPQSWIDSPAPRMRAAVRTPN